MTKIYHNPRCSKSRQGLQILEELNTDFEIIKYLDNPPTQEELTKLIAQLNIAPIELVRKEKPFGKKFKGKILTDAQIIKAMSDYPKLIERPIVIHNNKAVVGRPPTSIQTLF